MDRHPHRHPRAPDRRRRTSSPRTWRPRPRRKALEQAGLAAEDIELIIVATITPDTPTPATACYVQQHLGAFNAVAFDISAACSGFLYAMKISKRLISDGAFKNALIIGAEKLSTVTNWEDRTTCVLFGDGAGAAVLRRAEPGRRLHPRHRDGHRRQSHPSAQHPRRRHAPARSPRKTSATTSLTLTMMGKEVFKHAVNRMKEAAEKVIERAGLKPEDIACVIPHQANLRIIDAIADRLAVPNERVFVNLDKYGNTSAAAVAIALDEANRTGAFKRGEHIVLVVFGAGLTWAAAAIRW